MQECKKRLSLLNDVSEQKEQGDDIGQTNISAYSMGVVGPRTFRRKTGSVRKIKLPLHPVYRDVTASQVFMELHTQ